MTVLVLLHYKFNLSALLGDAAEQERQGRRVPANRAARTARKSPGTRRRTFYNKMDLLSLGHRAGARHRRAAAHPDPVLHGARLPRSPVVSVLWAIGIIGTFYLFTLALGFGAAALVGSAAIRAQNPAGNTAALSSHRRSARSSSAATRRRRFPRGHRGRRVRHHPRRCRGPDPRVIVEHRARLLRQCHQEGPGLGAAGGRGRTRFRSHHRRHLDLLGILAQDLNVAFLVALAFAVAASGNLPAILYSLFWKRFNTAGAVSAIYGGLISAVVLVFFSPSYPARPRPCSRRRTGSGSRCPTPASSRSHSASFAAGSARCSPPKRTPTSTPNLRSDR